MADYKVVFRADETSSDHAALLWEPPCPAMLAAVQVSRNVQTSEAYLQVKIRNVSEQSIGSVYGTATISYADGSSDIVSIEDLDVDLMPTNQKALKAVPLPRGDVESASVKLTHVGQISSKRESSLGPVTVPQQTPLSLSDKAIDERRRRLEAAGVDSRTYDYSVQDNGDWWVCACGQVNVGRSECCECGSEKAILIDSENEDDLCESSDNWSESVYARANELAQKDSDVAALSEACQLFESISGWKDSADRSSACNERLTKLKTAAARKRKRIVIIIASIIVVAVIATLLSVYVIIPMTKYNSAMSAADNGNYDEAISILTELGDYQDAKEQIENVKTRQLQAQYDEATALFEKGAFDDAYGLFSSISSFSDAKEKAIESANEAGAKAEKDNDFDSAIYWYEKANNTEAVNNAKYTFVKNNYDNSNQTTYYYLTDLKESNYLDSANLYADLYKITAQVIINDNRDDTETSLSTLGYKTNSRPVYHVYIDGGYSFSISLAAFQVLNSHMWLLLLLLLSRFSRV